MGGKGGGKGDWKKNSPAGLHDREAGLCVKNSRDVFDKGGGGRLPSREVSVLEKAAPGSALDLGDDVEPRVHESALYEPGVYDDDEDGPFV